jgi:hypothetical protein
MKQKAHVFLMTLLAAAVLAAGCLLGACESALIPPSYRAELPPLPPDWLALLGPPQWRIEWLDPDRGLCSAQGDGAGIQGLDLRIRGDWASPVTAFPFWPDRGIPPGTMRPAGAILPFDARGDRLRLSWQGGVEAVFYREMAALAPEHAAAPQRRPEYFDWPRFRELLAGDALPAELRRDLWLADWRDLALRTLESGFDRRRLTAPSRGELRLPMPPGETWIGTSPFAETRHWQEGEWASLEAGDGVDTALSPRGMLRYTRAAWVWIPWD